MKITHGIVIIDTPGYGDVGGFGWDKEITRMIGEFLNAEETLKHFDHINAVCFVASSTDSRLTSTHNYILDSVVSVFGSNIRDSALYLMTTFSKEMIQRSKQPIIKAIREA